MQATKEQAYEQIRALIERFSEHVEAYKHSKYNEHQTRVDFINPFFKALGWDMDNTQGHAEAYREVIHEDKVKVGGVTKAPDYGFTLFGQRKFFVDAKKPSVNIKDDLSPAYQVRRYGWSAKVPISIVTDFEEFAIYDCTKKPKPTDKASVARIKYLTYDKYLDEFDFLWDVFAKENLPKGRFDKYVQSDTSKKGTTTVDDEFLKSIEEWRRYLATTIALRNKSLNEDELNFAVQKTIDRIIFLRMCEDRGVEPYGELKKAAEKGDVYHNLFRLYKIANDKYNSGLFDFEHDSITPGLTIDNKALKTIIKELYYPHCEYEFSVMPADILGSVYERFLGKTIRLTPAHFAKIEEKLEVRKAGGVYYTPKYVVDYIVQNTVGKLLEGKTPTQAGKIKICDPACGSGSFLIGAYQFLLGWHLKYYTDNPPKKTKQNPLTPDGNLTTAEKKRILINNIFGVDIDAQAVEVTRLNLLLKALEGETQASISQQLSFFHDRVLPNLGNNIKCGNSLIGSDFYDNQLDLFPSQMKKINAFDWKQGFPEIFQQGGFDAVIGNPPYVLLSPDVNSLTEIEYLKKYEVSNYKVDLFHLFIERGILILKKGGLLGFIIPSTWLTQKFTKPLRKFVLQKTSIKQLLLFNYLVFQDANVFTQILIISNGAADTILNEVYSTIAESADHFHDLSPGDWNKISQRELVSSNSEDIVIEIRQIDQIGQIVGKIIASNPKLKNVARASLGCQAYNSSKHTQEQIKNRVFHSDVKLSQDYMRELAGKDVGRYTLEQIRGKWIKYGSWLHDYRTLDWLTGPRILIREITGKPPNRIQAVYTEESYCNYKTILNVNPSVDTSFGMKYLCGILNSRLLSIIFEKTSNKILATAFPRLSVGDLKNLPIKKIDFEKYTEKEKHDQISHYVDNLLQLNKQLQTTKLETQRNQIQRTIDHTERKIDELVYALYGLSQEEIGIIEQQ
jgi:predicted type IV restriction endonuclease